jgi:hypothetical protein
MGVACTSANWLLCWPKKKKVIAANTMQQLSASANASAGNVINFENWFTLRPEIKAGSVRVVFVIFMILCKRLKAGGRPGSSEQVF